METSVILLGTEERYGEANLKTGMSQSGTNEECNNGAKLVAPLPISSNPSTKVSLSLSSLEVDSSTTNKNPLECTGISDATQLSVGIPKSNEQLVTARKIQQEVEINARLELGFCYGQEMKDGGGKVQVSLDALNELKNLVAQERKQRLEADDKLAKLKNSVKSMNEEYSLFFDEVKDHLIEGGQGSASNSKERLDQLSKFVQVRFEKHVVEQIALKATVNDMNNVIHSLMEIINSQNLNESTTPAPPAKRNDTPQSKPNPKVVPTQPVKIIRKEANQIGSKTPFKQTAGKLEKDAEAKEHAEDTSKSHLKGFFCICGVEYTTKSNLIVHIRSLTEEGKFKCHICQEKFVLFYVLRRHLESTHKIKAKKGNGAHHIGCMDCGKTFSSQISFWKHRRSAHSQASIKNQSFSPSKRQVLQSRQEDTNDLIDEEPLAIKSPATFVTPKISKITSGTGFLSKKKHGMNIAKGHKLSKDITRGDCMSSNRPRRGLQIINVRGSLDDDTRFSFSTLQVSPEPIPIYFDGDDDDEEEVLVMPKLEPMEPAAPLFVKQGVKEEEREEDLSHNDLLVQVHEHDTTKRSKFFYCTCGVKFVSRRTIVTHIKQKTETWNYQCDICNKFYFYSSTLKLHMFKTHGKTYVSSKRDLKFPCKICGKSYPFKSYLTRHMGKSHKIYGDRAAEGAGSPFRSKRKNFCGKMKSSGQAANSRMANKTAFNGNSEHRQVSSISSAKYTCVCGLSYALKGSLFKHIAKKSRGKIFKCSQCHKGFVEAFSLKAHNKTVHKIDLGAKCHGCGICGELFQSANERNLHSVQIHGMVAGRRFKKNYRNN